MRRFGDLSPAEFEHLIFDLVYLRGARNVRWRTPGADGGRDIEALVGEVDFSGHVAIKKWYIECKRYASSVDWPTIYSKLAYADSQQADVLLMCTSSTFSPNAVSEADRWNSATRRTQIRLWPNHELEMQMLRHPDLQLKYGIASPHTVPGKSLVTLSLALSKTVSSHYSRQVFEGRPVDRMLKASQALADLLQRRMEDIEMHFQIKPAYFETLADAVGESVANNGFVAIDGFALKAFIAYLAALSDSQVRLARVSDRVCSIKKVSDGNWPIVRYHGAFASIATWGDFEFRIAGQLIEIYARPER